MTKITPLKDKKKALVTGSSVYWLSFVSKAFTDGWRVLGLDGMTDYYDIS